MDTLKEFVESTYQVRIKDETMSKIIRCVSNYEDININKLVKYLIKYLQTNKFDKNNPNEYLIKVVSTSLSYHWKQFQNQYLLTYQLAIDLDKHGFYGNLVDRDLIGLILNHAYNEYLNINAIRELYEKIRDYLIARRETKYSDYVRCLMSSKTLSKCNIPFDYLAKQASENMGMIERMLNELPPTTDS